MEPDETVKLMANLVDHLEVDSGEQLPNPVKMRKFNEAQKEKYLLSLAEKNKGRKKRFLLWLKDVEIPVQVEEDFFEKVKAELKSRV